MTGLGIFRQIGKAWAKAAKVFKPEGYIKEGRTHPAGASYCRGMTRAAGRRRQRAALRAASRVS